MPWWMAGGRVDMVDDEKARNELCSQAVPLSELAPDTHDQNLHSYDVIILLAGVTCAGQIPCLLRNRSISEPISSQ